MHTDDGGSYLCRLTWLFFFCIAYLYQLTLYLYGPTSSYIRMFVREWVTVYLYTPASPIYSHFMCFRQFYLLIETCFVCMGHEKPCLFQDCLCLYQGLQFGLWVSSVWYSQRLHQTSPALPKPVPSKKKLPALAFVPVCIVNLAWQAIKATIPQLLDVQEFIQYFEDMWLMENCPLQLWSVCVCVSE